MRDKELDYIEIIDNKEEIKYSCPQHGVIDRLDTMDIKVFKEGGLIYKSEPRCVKCVIELFEKYLPEIIEL